MKRFVILLLLLTAHAGFAQTADETYLKIYTLMQQGEAYQQTGQAPAAILKYTEAQAALKGLQTAHPTWNATVVKFRIEDLGERLDKLGKLTSSGSQPTQSRTTPPAQTTATSATVPLNDEQLTALNQEINRLRAENQMLEGKLKEAFAVQPATVSPREMAKAEARIVELQKESDLLKVALEQQQQSRPKETVKKPADPVPDAQAVVKEEAKLKTLQADRDDLEKKLKEAKRLIDSQKEALAEKSKLEKKLTDMEVDKKGLEDRLAQASKSLENLKAKTSDETKNVKRDQEKTDSLNKQKEELNVKLTAATKEVDQLKSTMERNDKTSSADQRRLKDLTKSNGELMAKVDGLKNDLKEVRAKATKVDDQQVAVMKSKLAVYEARPAPFTPEELALFRKPEQQIVEATKSAAAAPVKNSANLTPVVNTDAKPSGPKSDVVKKPKKTNRELPAGAGALAADAERAFAAHRFEDAEKKYLQVLAQDPVNVYTLGNLAAIELELNQIDKAEKYLKTALEQDAEDSFSLTLLGELRFRQEKFDEALDLLSKSADLNPKSAETQNYLGITLSQKGQRVPAEAALRKAIQLQPDYASAHHNLALVYATQKPPFIELARYHYQKSLALGHGKNPDLEKMLDVK